MVSLIRWIDRRWVFDLPIGAFPAVLERLEGTPIRAAALVAGISDAALATLPAAGWSIKEHLGHLNDLHTLDMQRLNEFLSTVPVLSPADVSNQQSAYSHYRTTPIDQVLEALRTHRRQLVAALENLTEADVNRTARHPRLDLPMRVIDWAQFVAEHDDHHLASARRVLRSLAGAATP